MDHTYNGATMNEVLIVNPRRNSKGRFVKRVRARRRNPVAAANPRRRHRRRNPVAAVATLAANPRRRRRRNPIAALAANPRRRRRRNPVSLAAFKPTSILGQLVPAAIGGAGALALDIALSKIPQPEFLNNPAGRFGFRTLGAIALGMVAGFIKPSIGRQVTAGALTVVAYQTIRDVVQKVAPQITINGYMDDNMGYVDPAPRLEGQGMGAYMGPRAAPMGAYMNPDATAMGNYGDGM